MNSAANLKTTPNSKVYVDVFASFNAEGRMTPEAIKWEDGSIFEIDKVLDVRQAASMRAGGQGDRYTVVVCGKQSFLFFERSAAKTGQDLGRWFVERRA